MHALSLERQLKMKTAVDIQHEEQIRQQQAGGFHRNDSEFLLRRLDEASTELAGAKAEIAALTEALLPFSQPGGDSDMQAYHDLEDDVIVWSNSGKGVTAGDVRRARECLADSRRFKTMQHVNDGDLPPPDPITGAPAWQAGVHFDRRRPPPSADIATVIAAFEEEQEAHHLAQKIERWWLNTIKPALLAWGMQPGASALEQATELLRGLRSFNHHGNGAPERVARAITEAHTAGVIEGREQMREEAAQIAEPKHKPRRNKSTGEHGRIAETSSKMAFQQRKDIAATIRALSLDAPATSDTKI